MTRQRVEGVDDPRLGPFRDLSGGGDRSWVVIEGELAVQRALRGPHRVETVVGTAVRIDRLMRSGGTAGQWLEVEPALMRALTGFDFHRGILAAMRRPAGDAPPNLVEVLRSRARSTVLVAESLADPANLGAVIRCARAFGVDWVVCSAQGADPWSRRAIRAAAGHIFAQPLHVAADVTALVQGLRNALPDAAVLAATVGPGAIFVEQAPRPAHSILMVGNEGQGLSSSLIAVADRAVTIPMRPEVDSLNVATATGILLYALTRRSSDPMSER